MKVRLFTPELDLSIPIEDIEAEISFYSQIISQSQGSLENYIDLLLDTTPSNVADDAIDSVINNAWNNLDPIEQIILEELAG